MVVTGGGSGIGESLARSFRAAGAAHVVVADLDGDQAERVADAVGGTAVAVDVADEAAVRQLVAAVEAEWGPIGVLCSNAGFLTYGGLEAPDENLQAMWAVHVMAHVYAARAVIPSMVANGGGYLLNTASAAGLLTQIGAMSYSVTKAAAVALGQWLAVSHHHQGIRVSVLCPQAVRTNLRINSPDGLEGADLEWSEQGVSGRDGVLSPDEVAACCLDAMREERFLVLPHPEVAEYVARRGSDIDRWLAGMRRFQEGLHPEGSMPGDALLSDGGSA
ncbi:MAG TPA: SDR family oxidoreductase [Acidimicrobiia bacterium]|nr:SDR family oxidoreductase [Acidimicrobiia bacterium]